MPDRMVQLSNQDISRKTKRIDSLLTVHILVSNQPAIHNIISHDHYNLRNWMAHINTAFALINVLLTVPMQWLVNADKCHFFAGSVAFLLNPKINSRKLVSKKRIK